MKTLFLIIFCLTAIIAVGQTGEYVTEEKGSAWIKVVEDPVPMTKPTTVKKQKASVKKKPASKPSTQKENPQDEFEKTNSQVNRFKKQQKG